MPVPQKIRIEEKLAAVTEPWQPRLLGELNGQHVRIAKLEGEFVWHAHENEDEMFLVIAGTMRIEFRDGNVDLEKGDMLIIPRGVEHKPIADEEAAVLLFEPATTLNTGTAPKSDRTVDSIEPI